MASRIKDPSSGSPSNTSGRITSGLPGITTSDTTTEQLLAQTAQEVVQNLQSATSGLAALTSVQQQQYAATQQNTAALEQAAAGRGSAIGTTLESATSSILGGGGLLSPLLSGIMSLFGGTSSKSATIPQQFSLPPPIAVQATISSAGTSSSPQPAQGSSSGAVIVQVNAMDSRSFLDHKDDIAQAVREAVLNSHALNDVLSQL